MRPTARTILPFRTIAWYFMRVSGLLLVFAIGFHMFWNTVMVRDVDITWDLISLRYQSPWWRLFDLSLLALSVLHGFYGLRTVMSDHLRPGAFRIAAMTVMHMLWISLLAFGAYVILSFPWRAA